MMLRSNEIIVWFGRLKMKSLFSLKCPKCGKGKLFKSYLKLVDKCDHCGEQLGDIRADDGPAWLSIVIVGHIVVPLAVYVAKVTNLTDIQTVVLWSVVTLLLCLVTLPFAKSFFVHRLWRIATKGQ